MSETHSLYVPAVRLRRAIPVLLSLNLARTLEFYRAKLGFDPVIEVDDYAGVERDGFQIHFWLTTEPALPKSSSCRIEVSHLSELYLELSEAGVVHPNGKLERKPWGSWEFSALDLDGNLLVFVERAETRDIEAMAHVNVTCLAEDLEALRSFYGETLGFVTLARPEGAGGEGAWYRIGAAELHVSIEDAPENARSRRHVAYEVRDLAGLRERLVAAGFEATTSREIAGVERFFTRDPAGNRIELTRRVRAARGETP